ncbi:hypothetical protein [Streptomyces sp. NPDC088923]|uniref:hypothetical protein n=1 Tax=Streptomyces sp. NPDC088923 TaxID=3365913 RepID=UPI0038109995
MNEVPRLPDEFTGLQVLVAPYDSERALLPAPPRLLVREGRLALRGETRGDRDERGVLWLPYAPRVDGDTRQRYAEVHGRRQRLLMARLRCQVCGRPSLHVPGRGTAYLLPYAPPETLLPVREAGEWRYALEANPPVCAEHLRTGPLWCDGLRRVRGWTVAWVLRAPVSGVQGYVYDLDDLERPPVLDYVPRGDPRLGAVVAVQLVRSLERVSVGESRPPGS